MNRYRIIAPPLSNIPWQDRPQGHINSPLWRCGENPIIRRNPLPGVARIFNSAVMLTERQVYLPSGCWQDIRDGSTLTGGGLVMAKAPLDSIPVFRRLRTEGQTKNG